MIRGLCLGLAELDEVVFDFVQALGCRVSWFHV